MVFRRATPVHTDPIPVYYKQFPYCFGFHFSTLLLGYKTAERLFELERIEGREEAVERLDDVLFHKIPYISDYI